MFPLALCLLVQSLTAQPLEDINYQYLYNSGLPFTFNFAIIKGSPDRVIYSLAADTSNKFTNYSISWETRSDLRQATGQPLPVSPEFSHRGNEDLGTFTFIPGDQQNFLVARVTHLDTHRVMLFFEALDQEFASSGYITDREGRPIVQPYLLSDVTYHFAGFTDARSLYIARYDQDFPVAAPPFSKLLKPVSATMKPDSVYMVDREKPISFQRPGLYLVQSDTTQPSGLSFRVESDYPRYSYLENLPGPLTYLCSDQEHKRLEKGRTSKKIFDRTILQIVGDADRAKQLIRNYFRRVEAANKLFTSYKEGWKTDRGMMYIIMGTPDEVFRFEDREIWKYHRPTNLDCTFLHAPSLFDPNNYVLLRSQKFSKAWMDTVNLWRNARK